MKELEMRIVHGLIDGPYANRELRISDMAFETIIFTAKACKGRYEGCRYDYYWNWKEMT